MNKATALLLLLLLCSCQLFDRQVPDEEELLRKRLGEINWKEVSTYPSVAGCGGILDKEAQKKCFFEGMARLVSERLNDGALALVYPENDTLRVKVTVFADAAVKFEPQLNEAGLSVNVKAIDSVLNAHLADFPKIEPAQKEGVPVTSQFILPVIITK
ncbi:hypothetical protein CHU92_04910 [Flavobacterium cyanobacteriorum]|uniref:TonB C-terminal domain-containing protein n=1 Tax=Flavobacterium cyanobacteriorum TaxID=2022802 RepID=A0A255ZAL9_9FLAO|nr:hypothetical protein [Flavobacterium cyanobacteriorum]OYQ38506.1 hypothetical protein CHU92_04910 [Flavobacterium cyanobacteriorum]